MRARAYSVVCTRRWPELARAHARIGLNTANDVGEVMVGALLTQAGYSLKDYQAGSRRPPDSPPWQTHARPRERSISRLVSDTMALDEYPLAIDVPQLQRVANSMFEFGLTPRARAPYQVSRMIQREPGLVGG